MILLFSFTICHRTYWMHLDLKIFPKTIVLLKVDRFKGFSNRSNVDKLVINSMSGCNYKNHNLNTV